MNYFLLAMFALIEAIIVVPCLVYIAYGRRFRRLMIMSYFTAGSIADYFEQFWSGQEEYSKLAARYREAQTAAHTGGPDNESKRTALAETERELALSLEQLYDFRFGVLDYLVPLIILAGVILVEAKFTVDYVEYLLAKGSATAADSKISELFFRDHPLLPDRVAVAALAGAFLWVGIDLFKRISSLTLLPGDLAYYALRMTVAPMLGYAIGTVAGGADTTVLVAFTICVLPFSDIMTWLRSAGARVANYKDEPESAPDRLINLPGVDSMIATRLQDQGISTIMQLCDVDPVQLSMRTGIDFAYVVRLVDEALVWRFVGPRLRDLNGFGWGGASDIAAVAADPSDLETASVAFAKAKEARDRATAIVEKARPEDAIYRALVERKEKAEQRLQKAANSLHRAPDSLEKLITAMEKVDGLKLTAAGLNNIANRIASDRYVHFIRRLMYEIDGEMSQPEKRPTVSSSLFSWFPFFGSRPIPPSVPPLAPEPPGGDQTPAPPAPEPQKGGQPSVALAPQKEARKDPAPVESKT